MYHCECVGGACLATGVWFCVVLLVMKLTRKIRSCVVVSGEVDGVCEWMFDDGQAAVYLRYG